MYVSIGSSDGLAMNWGQAITKTHNEQNLSHHIDGIAHDCGNSTANELELQQSFPVPSIGHLNTHIEKY